ncbi:hypothetical protein MSUIS_05980 [Mycoplasma suis KI3806]|uniref:Uncharacterized protein n=1 Tax=Mycoplasma suis (strain KI_3806) TaxID=708248 RepID=F0V210_MYCS3|nr:hypothetical protein [Mycoplasma suis]CBZ40691.1 hypothetical protein MSUIS_05980 [Mycoplasma suis KI3806]
MQIISLNIEGFLRGGLKSYESKQKLFLLNLGELIELLEAYRADLIGDSEEVQEGIKNTIDELNNLKSQLKEVFKLWEELKVKLSYFQNFEGKIQNSLCKNTQYSETQKCETSTSQVTQKISK